MSLKNIGANIGLLPFDRYSITLHQSRGSALLSNMIGIGLILSMRYQAESTPKPCKEIAMITFYWYPKCSTCKNAKAWLEANGIPYEAIDMIKEVPTKAQLLQWITSSGLPARRF